MFVYWLTLLISLLFINIHADINKSQHGSIIVAAEQQASDTFDGSGKHLENSIINNRRRRELYSE